MFGTSMNRGPGGGQSGRDGDRRHARKDDWLDGGMDHMGRGMGGRGRQGRDGRHGHGRGGRLGRLFAHGDLSLVLLNLLQEKERHGYEMIKSIEDMTQGTYTPSPGTVYPALTMLEEQGFVQVVSADGAKKMYAVTDEGKAHLAQSEPALKELLARVEQAGELRSAEAPSPRLIRAMENLKLSVRLKMAGDPLTETQVQALVDILDRAAGDIERS